MFRIVINPQDSTNKKFLDFCLLHISNNNRVLEIGPGEGHFAENIMKASDFTSYEFVDIYDKRIYQKDKPMKLANVSYGNIAMADSVIDVVIVSQVVEHLHNYTNLFLEMRRILVPDGILLIKLPNYSNIFQRIKFLCTGMPLRLSGVITNGGHINFIPYKFIIKFLSEYFELVDLKGDIFIDQSLTRLIFKLFRLDRYLINDSIANISLSHNVMVCLKSRKT